MWLSQLIQNIRQNKTTEIKFREKMKFLIFAFLAVLAAAAVMADDDNNVYPVAGN